MILPAAISILTLFLVKAAEGCLSGGSNGVSCIEGGLGASQGTCQDSQCFTLAMGPIVVQQGCVSVLDAPLKCAIPGTTCCSTNYCNLADGQTAPEGADATTATNSTGTDILTLLLGLLTGNTNAASSVSPMMGHGIVGLCSAILIPFLALGQIN